MLRLLRPALLLLAACTGAPEAPAPDAAGPAAAPAPAAPTGPRPNLVLLTLDTTRADHIGAYGHAAAETPTIDGLAREGLLFQRAYSVIPLTTPAHSSMMTGLYPTRHGIHNNGDAILPDELTTLAELLQARGYRTGASVSAFVTTKIWNIDQGFEAYFDQVKADEARRSRGRWARERRAGEVVDDLIAYVQALPPGEPFFLWGHFYDPHDPYEPPPEYRERFPDRPYDGEIAYMDAQIARLKAVIDARAAADGTAWILVADHGEALAREHGEASHGMFVFDPTMRIPFIVRPPVPLAQPVVERAQTVSNVDVMPTALGLLGLTPEAGLDGVDLSGFVKGAGAERPPVYMEAESPRQRFGFAPEHAIAHGPLKLIDTPNPRLFDVDADPKEENNLFAARPADAARLKQVNVEVQAKRVASVASDASPEVLAQLEALGYVGGAAPTNAAAGPLLDAKDQTQLITALEDARRLSTRGKFTESEAKYREVLQAHPQIGEARLGLARTLTQQRKHPEAEVVLREALLLEPQSAVVRTTLASNLEAQGRLEDALVVTEEVLRQVPADDVARNATLQLLFGLQRLDELKARAEAWTVDDPNNGTYAAWIGLTAMQQGQIPAAKAALERSLSDEMPRRAVHASLGRIAWSEGRLDEALRHLRAESAAFPDSRQARIDIANLLMKQRAWDEAAAEYAAVVARAPRRWELRRAWAQAVFNTGDYPAARDVLAPALEASPDDPEVLLLHANLLQKLGSPDEAQAVFARARELHAASVAAQRGAPVDAPMPSILVGEEEYQALQQYGIPER